jgi:hypothetical protein
MRTRFSRRLILLLAALVALAASAPAHAAGRAGADRAPVPPFSDFISSVTDGTVDAVRGVYVPERFALPVVQQPEGDDGFVSRERGVATQYGPAARYGTVGLLAHNYLAGSGFETLPVGQLFWIVYGDGRTVSYRVARIHRYQTLQPDSSSNTFLDLVDNRQVTTAEVFTKMYTGGDRVTFQTCIAADGNTSWGLLFVIALPNIEKGKALPR